MPITSHPWLYASSAYFVPFIRVSEPMQFIAQHKFYLANEKEEAGWGRGKQPTRGQSREEQEHLSSGPRGAAGRQLSSQLGKWQKKWFQSHRCPFLPIKGLFESGSRLKTKTKQNQLKMEEGSNSRSAWSILSGIMLLSNPSGDLGLRRADGVLTIAWVLRVKFPYDGDWHYSA